VRPKPLPWRGSKALFVLGGKSILREGTRFGRFLAGAGGSAAGARNFLYWRIHCPITGYVLPFPGVSGMRYNGTGRGGLAGRPTGFCGPGFWAAMIWLCWFIPKQTRRFPSGLSSCGTFLPKPVYWNEEYSPLSYTVLSKRFFSPFPAGLQVLSELFRVCVSGCWKIRRFARLTDGVQADYPLPSFSFRRIWSGTVRIIKFKEVKWKKIQFWL